MSSATSREAMAMQGSGKSLAAAESQRRQRFSSTSRRPGSGAAPAPTAETPSSDQGNKSAISKVGIYPAKARTSSTSRNVKPVAPTAATTTASLLTSNTAEVRVTEYQETKDAKGENIVVYIISVTPADVTKPPWTLQRQYVEFSNLDRILRKLPRGGDTPQFKIPPLPTKETIVADASYFEARRDRLDTYFVKLISQSDVWLLSDIQRFLEPTVKFYEELVVTKPRINYEGQSKKEVTVFKIDVSGRLLAQKELTDTSSDVTAAETLDTDTEIASPVESAKKLAVRSSEKLKPVPKEPVIQTPKETPAIETSLPESKVPVPVNPEFKSYAYDLPIPVSTTRAIPAFPLILSPARPKAQSASLVDVKHGELASLTPKKIESESSSTQTPSPSAPSPLTTTPVSKPLENSRLISHSLPLKKNSPALKKNQNDFKINSIALDKIDVSTQYMLDVGAQRQLWHPAIRNFWRLKFDGLHKLGYDLFLKTAEMHLKEEATSLEPSMEASIEFVVEDLKTTMGLAVSNEEEEGIVSVFEMNQWTKHLNPELDLLHVLKGISSIPALKLVPPVQSKCLDQIVWGTNLYKKPLQDIVMASLQTPDSWTVVYGPVLSGKTFRWHIGTQFLDVKDTVIWLDLINVTTVQEMLSAVSSQLSLSVLALDDVLVELKTLLEKTAGRSSGVCCFVFDHLNLAYKEIIYPLLKLIRRIKKSVPKLSTVMITTSEGRPAIDEIAKEIKLPMSAVNVQYIGPLLKGDAIKLAEIFNSPDPSILVEASRYLPGHVKNLKHLSLSALTSITRTVDTSVLNKHSTTPTTHIRDIVLSDNLTESEAIVARCLYAPLSNGIVFSKALAWHLCGEHFKGDANLFLHSFENLVDIGWIRVGGECGYFISNTSCLPTAKPPLISESAINQSVIVDSSQWSMYYRYWINEAVRINEMFRSKDQLIACSYYDFNRTHFQVLFDGLYASPYFKGSILQNAVNDLVGVLSSNINLLLEYRQLPVEGLKICSSILRILCHGDDSGAIPDDKYWKLDNKLKPVILRAVVNLAWEIYRTGQYELAEEKLEAILQYFGHGDEVVYSFALNKLAVMYRGQGKNEESLEVHKKCYALRMQVFGEDHLDSAQSMNNIAIVLNALGRHEESVKAHERCIAIRTALLGPKHVAVGDSNFNLGGVYLSMNMNNEALECYKKARAAYVPNYGRKHSYVREIDAKINALTNTA